MKFKTDENGQVYVTAFAWNIYFLHQTFLGHQSTLDLALLGLAVILSTLSELNRLFFLNKLIKKISTAGNIWFVQHFMALQKSWTISLGLPVLPFKVQFFLLKKKENS